MLEKLFSAAAAVVFPSFLPTRGTVFTILSCCKRQTSLRVEFAKSSLSARIVMGALLIINERQNRFFLHVPTATRHICWIHCF